MGLKPNPLYAELLEEYKELLLSPEFNYNKTKTAHHLWHKYKVGEQGVNINSFRHKMNEYYIRRYGTDKDLGITGKDSLIAIRKKIDSGGEVETETSYKYGKSEDDNEAVDLSKAQVDMIEGLKNLTEEQQVGLRHMKYIWVKTPGASSFVKNPLFVDPDDDGFDIEDINFDEIIAKHVQPIVYNPKVIKTDYLFDRLVYSDVHVGMDPNPDGYSLYYAEWGEKQVMERSDYMIDHVIARKKSNIIYVDDLGDLADGWDGVTSRGGHDLPQNMGNEEMFDCAFGFKMSQAQKLAQHYEKVVFNCVCNSNHAGSGFDYVINKAFKNAVEILLPNVTVNLYRRFMVHYSVGKYTFLLTHGKDSKNKKVGFPTVIDNSTEKKIKNYLERYRIQTFDNRIEVSKGDGHRKMYDDSTSDLFSYYAYPTFAPNSDWVKTNYQHGRSGFDFFNFRKKMREPERHPVNFEYIFPPKMNYGKA